MKNDTNNDTKTDSKATNGRMRRLVRLYFLNWWKSQISAAMELLIHLPRYIIDKHDYRKYNEPTSPRVLFGDLRLYSVRIWQSPRLDVRVGDGMAEHYGYPRHACYLVVWWNRKGYAFGLEYLPNVKLNRRPSNTENL